MADHAVTLELYYAGAWHPAPVYTRDGLTIMRGAATFGAQTPPGSAEPTIDNRTGNYSPRNVAGALYGLLAQNMPARVAADGSVRITGEVALWKPERALGGDAWTETQVVGILQRIGRGTDPIDSAVTRSTLAMEPVAYWTLETPGGALTPDTPAMVVKTGVNVTWAESDTLVGSLPLPRLIVEGTTYPDDDFGVLQADARATSATGWSVGCWFLAETTYTGGFNSTNLLEWGGVPTGSAGRGWEIAIAHDATSPPTNCGIFVQMDGTSRSQQFNVVVEDGQPHHVLVTAEQTSANVIAVKLYLDGVVAGTVSSPTPYTLRAVDVVQVAARVEDDPTQNPDLWAGHVAVFDRVLDATDAAALYAMGDGYTGETADDRFLRLCAEDAISASIVGTADDTVLMGPQVPATLLELFAEIERTDDATIYEARTTASLVMRTGASKLNQAPDLTLYCDGGQIAPPLKPVVGDEHIRNDVTAASPGGAARRVQQLAGPHNVQAPSADPQGVGRYKTRIDVNPSTDNALSDAAGWRVSHGTYDGTWYAEITVDLDAAPYLITVAAAIDIGDCVSLANLPVDEALDAVEHIVIGIKEDLPPKRRTITFYCVPAAPYQVGLLATTSGDTGDFLGHLDTDDSETVAAVAAGAATFLGRTNEGPLWTTTADDFPFDVIVGGQRVGVSSISSAVNDAYSRTEANGWGTEPTSGAAYTTSGGAASDYAVAAGVATMAVTSANVFRSAALDVGTSHKSVKVAVALNVNSAGGATITQWVCGRYLDASNYYVGRLDVSTAGVVSFAVFKRVAGTLTSLVSAGTVGTGHASGDSWKVRIDCFGSTIQAKAWLGAFSAEPAAWTIETTDSDIPTGTSLGLLCRRETGNTDGALVATWDALEVTNPQRFTVQTTGRQVRYAIASGSQFNVQQPVILAQ